MIDPIGAELPEGWAGTTLGDLVSPSRERVEPSERLEAPYLSLEHVESGTNLILGHGDAADVQSTKAVFRPGDILYGRLRPYLNKVCIPDFGGICSTDFLVFSPPEGVENRLLLWFLSQPAVVEYANHHSSGVSLPRVSFDRLACLDLPLPPLAEQRRIVTKVEALLERVGAARQRLAKVPALLKRFRQSVLAAACSGRLTADWREQHPSEPSGELLLEQIRAERESEGSRRVPLQDGDPGDIPPSWSWSTFGDVTRNFDGRRVPIKADDRKLRRGEYLYYGASGPIDTIDDYLFDGEFLLVGEDGANLLMRSTPIAFRAGGRFWVNNHAHVVQTYGGIPLEYLEAYLNRIDLQEYVTGSAQPKLTQANLNRIPVPVPPLAEQREIVRWVEGLFRLAAAVERRVVLGAGRVEKLTQAILARAFRGELVPTEAELARRDGRPYEPAAVLLERIRAARDGGPSSPAARRRPTPAAPPADSAPRRPRRRR